MLSTCLRYALGAVLVLTTACQKQPEDPAPVAPQVPLEGRWQQGDGSYKIFDNKGVTLDSGHTPSPNPAVYHTLDATTWKQSGQLHNEYIYVRQDSIITRSFYYDYNGSRDHLDSKLRILELTPTRLVLRETTAYTNGTNTTEITNYSR
jgi:hypothetical protein